MARYYEKTSVDALVGAFGNSDVLQSALGKLQQYNDNGNKPKGRWLDMTYWTLFEINNEEIEKITFRTAYCSNCQAQVTIDDYDNYCPRCGAIMEYKETEEEEE